MAVIPVDKYRCRRRVSIDELFCGKISPRPVIVIPVAAGDPSLGILHRPLFDARRKIRLVFCIPQVHRLKLESPAHEMRVIVDEPGQQKSSLKVHDFCRR